jgi:TM2 domain-containing membrane protein YozV
LYNQPPAYQYNQPPAYAQNHPPPYVVVVAEKNPGVAVLLSFFMPGAGQIYNGDVGKALLFFFGVWILVWVLGGWGFWIAGMIDAHQSAQRINLGRRI